jgi:hypothetical protein
LQTLVNVPFLNEERGNQILKDLTNCIVNHWYSHKSLWNGKVIIERIEELKELVISDYMISGSFVLNSDDYISWNLEISINN